MPPTPKKRLAYPWITLTLSTLSLALFLLHIAPAFAYDRLAIHQLHRLLTCHLTHWSLDHLFWDLAVFLTLGLICERRLPRPFLLCLALASLSIPLAVHYFEPHLQTYRGLSGLDSALFALLATTLLRDKLRHRQWLPASAIAALCLAFIAKIILEYATGTTLFVNAPSAGFVPVPLAHLVGAAAGMLTVLAPTVPVPAVLRQCRMMR